MEICSALLALCVGNSPVTGEFPLQRPVTQSFDVIVTAQAVPRICCLTPGVLHLRDGL